MPNGYPTPMTITAAGTPEAGYVVQIEDGPEKGIYRSTAPNVIEAVAHALTDHAAQFTETFPPAAPPIPNSHPVAADVPPPAVVAETVAAHSEQLDHHDSLLASLGAKVERLLGMAEVSSNGPISPYTPQPRTDGASAGADPGPADAAGEQPASEQHTG